MHDYVTMMPLNSAALTEDAGVVHTLLASCISKKEMVEAKVLGLINKADG